ncbi:MAG: hypothetical protein JSV04_02580 [Candidatus Heimdallarchaeota archaeon]|nr:MAG: hypothetical protein JSV04_02580 [Candidatus Heimdallarchaeota archaeon]
MLEKVIEIEWKAQDLQCRYNNSGPLIEQITRIPPDIGTEETRSFNYLIMQGSFDPPTVSHLELLSKAIDLRSKSSPHEMSHLILLLSLSHVDKKLDVTKRSLLGHRVVMLEKLFSEFDLGLPITIGLSNVARYIELITASEKSLNKSNNVTFIMGMDVFEKVLDPNYYSKPLEELIPLIFQTNYIVAGRKEVFSEKSFSSFLNKYLSAAFHVQVSFLLMPEHLRFRNATQIRERFSKDLPSQEKDIHPIILQYLKENNLYHQSPEWLATKIAIQTITQLTLTANNDQILAQKILKVLLPEIQRNETLQQRLIDEYQTNKNVEISKKWNQIRKSIS